MSPPTRARWVDRIVGVAVGSFATAWFLRGDSNATRAEIDDAPVGSESRASPIESSTPSAIADARVNPPALSSSTASVPEPEVETSTITTKAPDEPVDLATPTEIAVPASGAAPTLPLPRMPGDTRLSSSSRFDDTTQTWNLKAAFRVVARDHHVIAFYRKALADQGLAVTQSEDPPGVDGTTKIYLHGKSARIHAQVGIAPRTDTLETRVWILWRTRA